MWFRTKEDYEKLLVHIIEDWDLSTDSRPGKFELSKKLSDMYYIGDLEEEGVVDLIATGEADGVHEFPMHVNSVTYPVNRLNLVGHYKMLPLDPCAIEHALHMGWLVKNKPVTSAGTKDQQKISKPLNETKIQEKPMSTAKTLAITAATANKTAATLALKIAVGKAGNKVVGSVITPKLPMMARGIMSSKFGPTISANIAVMSVSQFMPDNHKAKVVSQAMLEAAMLEAAMLDLLAEFDIESMMDDLLTQVSGSKVDKLLKTELDLEE